MRETAKLSTSISIFVHRRPPGLRIAIALAIATFGAGAVKGWSDDAKAGAGAGEYVCRFTPQPLKVDGRGEDPQWRHAALLSDFYAPGSAAPIEGVQLRMLWDREYLYLLAECVDAQVQTGDQPAKLPFGPSSQDQLWLCLKPSPKHPGQFQWLWNAGGASSDLFLPGADEPSRPFADKPLGRLSRVVVDNVEGAGWTLETRIAWSNLVAAGGRPQVDEVWQWIAGRNDADEKGERITLSTKRAPLNAAATPAALGRLRFAGPELTDSDGKRSTLLDDLKRHWRTAPSRVVGSPEPPLPYRARRVHEHLRLSTPIFAAVEPTTHRLWIIDQDGMGKTGRLLRSKTSAWKEMEVALELPAGSVAYSLIFHRHFDRNGFLYLGWNGFLPEQEASATDASKKHSQVTRYTLQRIAADDPSSDRTLDPKSALPIIHWPSNGHNGAAIAFGHDGLLYVTTGDGTSDSDTDLTGQGLNHLLAKVLRIDVDRPEEGRAYSIPRDNPFLQREGVRPETWAYGFRNPWRMTVDAETGDLWVGNNGQDLYEQAFLVRPGANYGWSVYEGSHIFYAERKLGPDPHVPPTVEHPHSEARSLTGGIVYYGRRYPELRGAYVYGDYSTGKIWGAKVRDGKLDWQRELADTTLQIAAFAADAEGELLVVDHRDNHEGGLYTLDVQDSPGDPASFPRTLRDTGLFVDVPNYQTHPGLMPYDVNAPLWSDGAWKQRHLHLPSPLPGEESSWLHFNGSRGWNLPDGTVAVKSFAVETVEGDPQSRRWIETRLLTRQEGEWVGYSYRWNADQSEAALVDSTGVDSMYEVQTNNGVEQRKWRFPSRTECMVCHSRAANYVLGLSTAQFNRSFDYGGQEAQQLEVLEFLGALRINWLSEVKKSLKEQSEQSPADQDLKARRAAADRAAKQNVPQRPAPMSSLMLAEPQRLDQLANPSDEEAPLEARARAYLHANCAQCHVAAGGGNSQFDLDYRVTLKETKLIGQQPLHHRFGIPQPLLIAPGEPQRSVLLHRVGIRGPGQMPQLATERVDEAAAAMLRKWIDQLPRKPRPPREE